MNRELLIKGLTKLLLGLGLLMVFIFIPAGTFRFFGGWLFLGLLFVPMIAVGAVLAVKEPFLLEKRLNSQEKESEQRGVVAMSGLMFLAGFIVAGLDRRFGWSHMPAWVTVLASVLFIGSYIMYAEVLRENAYLSRTVEVQEGQKVIDTGLYGVVRHPMYSATVLMFLTMPLILGSLFSFIIFLSYPFIIAARIRNEEKVLEEGLEGYREYKSKVRYRIIPFIW